MEGETQDLRGGVEAGHRPTVLPSMTETTHSNVEEKFEELLLTIKRVVKENNKSQQNITYVRK